MHSAKLLLLLMLASGWLASASAANTNSLVWQAATDRVSADVRGEALWPLLEDIAHQTGWHIFVEPGADRKADVKFKDLPRGEALKKLLGDLNFAFVPQTNRADFLYVFMTTMQAATQRVAETNQARHVANQLLVKVKPGTDIDALAKSVGGRVIGRDDALGIYLLEFDNETAMEAALASLKTDPDVEAVGYNYLYDTPTAMQPAANSATQPVSLTLDPSKTGDPCNPIIGLIDTRVQPLGGQLDQFMLKPISVVGSAGTTGSAQTQSLAREIDQFKPEQASASSSASPTHGTAMAETILRAVAQQTSTTSVKILPVDVYGDSELASTWNVAMGVKAAVDGGATVLNMSLGATDDSPILDRIVQQAIAKGVVIFAAAGNEPVNTPTYPAAIPGVNAVTALGASGQLASYANYGNFVEMALPGASMVFLGDQAYVVQGTSPASAYAAGVAAGYKGVNCDTWLQIQAMMRQKFPVPQK